MTKVSMAIRQNSVDDRLPNKIRASVTCLEDTKLIKIKKGHLEHLRLESPPDKLLSA